MAKMNPHELNYLGLVQGFRNGALLNHADDKLAELLAAISETGGSGKITQQFVFKVNKAGQMEVVAEVKITKPTRPLGTGIFFLTEDNTLTKRDPRQFDIEDEIERRRALED